MMGWVVGQFGHWGLRGQGAYAWAAEAGYQLPNAFLKPWFRVGYNFYSGDGNPNNNRHGTFIPILPSPRPYARCPFFTESNLKDAFAMMILKPTGKLTLRSDVHSLQLAKRHDLWYSGGGAFQDSTFRYQGRTSAGFGDLATLVDTSADYALTKNTTLSLYVAYANGGRIIGGLFSSRDSLYGLAEANIRF